MTPQDQADARALAAKTWMSAVAFHDDHLEAIEAAGETLAVHAARYLHAGEESLAARHATAHVILADIYRRAIDARLATLKRRIAAQT